MCLKPYNRESNNDLKKKRAGKLFVVIIFIFFKPGVISL